MGLSNSDLVIASATSRVWVIVNKNDKSVTAMTILDLKYLIVEVFFLLNDNTYKHTGY